MYQISLAPARRKGSRPRPVLRTLIAAEFSQQISIVFVTIDLSNSQLRSRIIRLLSESFFSCHHGTDMTSKRTPSRSLGIGQGGRQLLPRPADMRSQRLGAQQQRGGWYWMTQGDSGARRWANQILRSHTVVDQSNCPDMISTVACLGYGGMRCGSWRS